MSMLINWEEQWATHAPGFRDGLAHILLPNHIEIVLKSGPGFGDFSHLTTQLMVRMMHPHVMGKKVLDIGCGSGILSIAAMKLGASAVSWLDIDPEALAHAAKNAQLNHISPKQLSNPNIVLMNMIASEQKTAWMAHQTSFDILITSGILASQREEYLSYAAQQNWELLEEHHFGEWKGFIFKETS